MKSMVPVSPSVDLKILHVNTAKTWRGGEQQVLYLARALREMGIQQTVAVRTDSELEKRCLEEGIETVSFPFLGEWDLFSGFSLGRYAKKNGFSILHAHTARAHTMGLYASRLAPALKLLISRRVDFPAGKNSLSRKKYFHPAIGFYLAISDNVKRILISDGIPEDKIRIAYSGIDVDRFSTKREVEQLRREFHIPETELTIGNVAACVPHKDQLTLIRAMEALDKRSEGIKGLPPYRLLIVGEGELRKSLEEEARRAGLISRRKVTFTGFRKDIENFLSLFDIFVMSSKEEGLGTSVLDAMASGLPVAVTEGGGLPEMIDPGKGGWVTPVGDPDALSVSLEKLLLSKSDRKKFGEYNKKRVLDFDYKTTASSTLKVYRELLAIPD